MLLELIQHDADLRQSCGDVRIACHLARGFWSLRLECHQGRIERAPIIDDLFCARVDTICVKLSLRLSL
jgi:hypothetical protein